MLTHPFLKLLTRFSSNLPDVTHLVPTFTFSPCCGKQTGEINIVRSTGRSNFSIAMSLLYLWTWLYSGWRMIFWSCLFSSDFSTVDLYDIFIMILDAFQCYFNQCNINAICHISNQAFLSDLICIMGNKMQFMFVMIIFHI